jgi:hypothetical protein
MSSEAPADAQTLRRLADERRRLADLVDRLSVHAERAGDAPSSAASTRFERELEDDLERAEAASRYWSDVFSQLDRRDGR